MNKNYTVYHLHSDLSNGVTNIDSVTKYNEYVDYAKSLGMKAMGFSEHGSILEWTHKKNKIEAAGMKYIHAEEFYITENIIEGNLQRDNYHCVLIAKNYNGVLELNNLSSKAFLRDGHFYYTPRITFDELISTSKNIIITTACIGGILSKGEKTLQYKFLKFLIENKDRCFLEIQHHCDEVQINYNKLLLMIMKKYQIPLIAGTDTHALNNKHLRGRAIMQKSKGVSFENESDWDLIFKTYDELVRAYDRQNALPADIYLEAIENTNKMANMIEVFELDYSKKYPKLYDDSMRVLKQKIVEGTKKRGINKYKNYHQYKKRIAYELETYKHNDAVDFILLEEDYKNALKRQGVNFGYSRGSVSGSVIAYLLGITEVDSVKFNLNFERFMNKERVSLADIDTDWYKEDRWKVREYLFNKQGVHCCNIITFNTIKMRGAIKDVGRALGMSPEQTQALSDLVQEDDNKKEFIDDKYRIKYKKLFEYVDIVIGTITSLGRHAAGLVVSPHNVDCSFGTLHISSDEKPISQINMKEIDSLNYVKLDILGLDCVGLINEACKLANIPFLTPDNMDFNDMKVWNDIAKDTTLIFQFESDFAGLYLRDILSEETIKNIKEQNPNFSYIDLMSMANGAIRPAGASYRNELSQGIYRDNGHPVLNEFLSPTLGYLVYQEQIIEFLYKFCGFTMGEADIVRRHFSKKTGTEHDIPLIKNGGYMINENGEKSSHYIKGFINIMKENYNISKEESEKLIVNFLQVIIDASDYLFSKDHADPYSFLGFACGYLRHYFPIETFTAALNIYSSDSEKSANIKTYINKKGYSIEPIKFGHSKAGYWFDKDKCIIYQGISSIKYCNQIIANELYELSKAKKYDSFVEIIKDIKAQTSVNSRQLKILTILNFFSDYGSNKKLLQTIDLFDKFYARKEIKKIDIETLGIDMSKFIRCFDNETPKMYKTLHMDKYIGLVSKDLEDKALSIKEQIKYELEYLEYIKYINPKAPSDMYYVIEVKFYKDKTKPYLTLYNLRTGEFIKTKITSGKRFIENTFVEGSIINVLEFKEKNKLKKINDSWVETSELEKIVVNWDVY